MVVAGVASARAQGGRRAHPPRRPQDLARAAGGPVVRGAEDGRMARSDQGRDRRPAQAPRGLEQSARHVKSRTRHDAVIERRRGEQKLAKISRALISVSDKTGLVDFARRLSAAGARDPVDGRARRGRSPRRASRCARSATSPARPRSSTAGSRRCTRACTAASWGGPPPRTARRCRRRGSSRSTSWS